MSSDTYQVSLDRIDGDTLALTCVTGRAGGPNDHAYGRSFVLMCLIELARRAAPRGPLAQATDGAAFWDEGWHRDHVGRFVAWSRLVSRANVVDEGAEPDDDAPRHTFVVEARVTDPRWLFGVEPGYAGGVTAFDVFWNDPVRSDAAWEPWRVEAEWSRAAPVDPHRDAEGLVERLALAGDAVKALLTDRVRPWLVPAGAVRGHRTPISSVAVSPCGRWVATGSAFDPTKGVSYDDGGVVCVWDARRGACVNAFALPEGGVGFPLEGHAHALQWVAERSLFVSVGAVGVARLDPFGEGLACVAYERDLDATWDGIPPGFCAVDATTALVNGILVDLGGPAPAVLGRTADPDAFRRRAVRVGDHLTDGADTVTLALEPAAPVPFVDRRLGPAAITVDGGSLRVDGVRLGATRTMAWSDPDLVPACASPDGRSVAWIDPDDQLRVAWIDGTPIAHHPADGAVGFAFAAGWTGVCVRPDRLSFVDLRDGTARAAFAVPGDALVPRSFARRHPW